MRDLLALPTHLPTSDSDQKEVEVVFLEANFTPDCERAAQFYPDFFDSVLQTLFLGGGSDKTRRL